MSTGLYIHIPFCRGRCHYCHFLSVPDPAPEFRQRYLGMLGREAEAARRKYGPILFDTLYLGGGTPSLLSGNEMRALLEMLRERFRFKKDAEITCEWNPGDGEEEKLSVFTVLGINRISLGVQSFQDPLLARLGRRHSTYDTLKTFEKIRQAGVGNVSLDLMLKIPGQKVPDFRDSLQRCGELGAAQVSLYDLEVHEATVFGQMRKKGELVLPDEEEHARMYQSACEMLGRAGYEHYEISNFAKPGFASRHNLIYWHNQSYLGLGAGAFSYLGGTRYQFASDVGRYLEKCAAGDWRNDQEDVLSGEEQETETFAMELRLEEGAAPSDFPRVYPALRERVQVLLQDGLLGCSEDRIRLTARGKFVSEEVFGFLLQNEQSHDLLRTGPLKRR